MARFNLRNENFQNFPEHAPDSLATACVVHTLCKLDQQCQTPTLNSAATHHNVHNTSMKPNISQPPTLIYSYTFGLVPALGAT